METLFGVALDFLFKTCTMDALEVDKAAQKAKWLPQHGHVPSRAGDMLLLNSMIGVAVAQSYCALHTESILVRQKSCLVTVSHRSLVRLGSCPPWMSSNMGVAGFMVVGWERKSISVDRCLLSVW